MSDLVMGSINFSMDQENSNKLMNQIVSDLMQKCKRLQREVNHCRNELCLKCGRYHDAHLGACDDCRFRHGGEWERDME